VSGHDAEIPTQFFNMSGMSFPPGPSTDPAPSTSTGETGQKRGHSPPPTGAIDVGQLETPAKRGRTEEDQAPDQPSTSGQASTSGQTTRVMYYLVPKNVLSFAMQWIGSNDFFCCFSESISVQLLQHIVVSQRRSRGPHGLPTRSIGRGFVTGK
jgi:hypothetical protein